MSSLPLKTNLKFEILARIFAHKLTLSTSTCNLLIYMATLFQNSYNVKNLRAK